jgi:hypothetical protein
MARSNRSWLSGPEPLESGQPQGYPGQSLGLPEGGTGSLAGLGRRVAALFVDWLLAYGLAALAMSLGLVSLRLLSSAILVIWLILGIVSVRLFSFTPGQFALGVRVASVDERQHVGVGRATARGVLVALVVPALFVDVDGRGLQDRLTGTAIVRR